RYQMLYSELAVSKKEVEEAEKSLRKARLGYEEARKSSVAREAEFSLRKQGFELERAKEAFSLLGKKLRPRERIDLSSPEKLSQIYPLLKEAEITSPIAGIVIKVNAKKGDITKKEETEARFKIAEMSNLFAELEISEHDIGRVKIGQKVGLKITSTKKSLTGQIIEISQETKKSQGDRGEEKTSIVVKCKIDTKGVRLRLGAGLEAEIEVSSLENVLLAPLEAILEAEGGKVVYVVKDKKASARKVVIGIWGEREAEVKKGLKEGEEVITVGALDITEGARVKVKSGGSGQGEVGSGK
ncbi:efflux RND transporter periplasmic adaptor subunit, partial [bacterium]|nr:efflux RND transporter periplasmic adaptor subunit [bacterium]